MAATAWYGWKNFARLRGTGENQATVINQSSHVMERIRVSVGGETVVIEQLAVGDRASRPFRGGTDATFELRWQYQGVLGEQSWSGGTTTAGPLHMRHTFLVDDRNSVIWNSELLPERK